MKTLRKISLLFVLFYIYAYTISIDNIPKTITVFEGEQINFSTLWGVEIKRKDNSVETSTNLYSNTFEKVGNEQLTVSLFDKIDLKTIDVNVMAQTEVIPVGEIVGIKLYTSGVLVVGTSAIEDENGNICKPFENAKIQEGDSIIAINEKIVNNTNELIEAINEAQGNTVEVTYVREQEEQRCEITPVKDKENNYKIGLWVRDSAAGVGTLTFYNEQTECFAALGHAITDIDTGDIINTSSGEIDGVNIVSIVKGEKEEPGKIQGAIKQGSIIGNVYKNTKFGIYGVIKYKSNIELDYSKRVKVALRQEIKEGEATIISNVDGQSKEYSIEIKRIFLNNTYDNKSMLIKVTDEELLEKTGGIVQGMSGSPIIQNDKFIGAVTHVLVNDPTVGYAVFADRMIQECME